MAYSLCVISFLPNTYHRHLRLAETVSCPHLACSHSLLDWILPITAEQLFSNPRRYRTVLNIFINEAHEIHILLLLRVNWHSVIKDFF